MARRIVVRSTVRRLLEPARHRHATLTSSPARAAPEPGTAETEGKNKTSISGNTAPGTRAREAAPYQARTYPLEAEKLHMSVEAVSCGGVSVHRFSPGAGGAGGYCP